MDGVTESYCQMCERPEWHDCKWPDRMKPNVPQDARGRDSDGSTRAPALQSPDLSPGAASEAGPLDSGKRCVVCGSQAGVHLTVAPVCPHHASPVALERALETWRSLMPALSRWLAAKDAWMGMDWTQERLKVDSCLDELSLATRALEDVAREVCR